MGNGNFLFEDNKHQDMVFINQLASRPKQKFKLLVEDYSTNIGNNKRMRLQSTCSNQHTDSFSLVESQHLKGLPTLLPTVNCNKERIRSISACTPGLTPLRRRVRGERKKCRAVFGVENKSQWCKACIWKKACTRFPG